VNLTITIIQPSVEQYALPVIIMISNTALCLQALG